MTPKNFSESHMIHHIIIFLSLSFSMLGMILYVIEMHDALEIPVLMMVDSINRYKRNNITNTSDKYRAYRCEER